MRTEQEIRAEYEELKNWLREYCNPPGGIMRESPAFQWGWYLALEWVLDECPSPVQKPVL